MSVQITLNVPDAVYKKAQETAEASNRPIRDLLSDVIVDAFPQMPQHPEAAAYQRETEAFEQMYDELVKQYPNEDVAIYQGEVVDHDVDPVELMFRVREAFPNKPVLMRSVNEPPGHILHFRSPRLVR